jgi:hypothetical protein
MMSRIFSYLLDQPVKDTLCGTKALWWRDWERIEMQFGSWGVAIAGLITNCCSAPPGCISRSSTFRLIIRRVSTASARW